MKTIKVVAAIIIQNGYVLTTQRGYGDYKDRWEFPGGKIEQGETPQEALAREIKEELDVEIEVGDYFKSVEYDYSDFHLFMDCFLCSIRAGKLTLKEHENATWLTENTLENVNWLPADQNLIPLVKEYLDQFKC